MTMANSEQRGTALVTGASSGIGLELARQLAAAGHALVVVSRDREKLDAAAEQLRSEYDVPVRAYSKDLSEPAATEQLWAELSLAGVTIDILVNNAGVGLYGELWEQSLNALTRMQIINVVALTTLTRLALPGMVARRRGRILNVASVVSYQPGGPGMAAYYATKSYVLSFSKGLALELTGSGVSVTALCPGTTASSFEGTAGASRTILYRRLPKMNAAAVAKAGYRGMMRGRLTVVPGLMTKFMALAGEFPPRIIGLYVNRWLLRSG